MALDIVKSAESAKAAEAGAPELSTLEIRLERIKCASNFSLDFLKRLYNRRTIAELYLQHEICLHVHFLARDRVFCARYSAGKIEKTEAVGIGKNLKIKNPLVEREASVLVWVGDVTESLRPVASTVWLQSLDGCYMRGIEAIEPLLLPKREDLLLVFDNELRALDNFPRVEKGQFVNQVIEGAPQIIANLPDQYCEHQRDAKSFRSVELDFVRSIWVGLPANRIMLGLPEGVDQSFKLTKAFACPCCPGESTIERRGDWCASIHG